MNTRNKPNVLNTNVQSPSLTGRSLAEDSIADLKSFFSKGISEMENRLTQRFGELVADISNFRTELKLMNDRVLVLEEKLTAVNKVVSNMQVRINNYENDSILTDVIMHNVPADANVNSVVKSVFDKIGCNFIPRNSFRITAAASNTKSTSNTNNNNNS